MRHQRLKLRRIGALRHDHVEEAAEIGGEAEGAHFIRAAFVGNQARKTKLAFHRGHGRGQRERLRA